MKLQELLEKRNFHLMSCTDITSKLNGAEMDEAQIRSFDSHKAEAEKLNAEITKHRETETRALWAQLELNKSREPETRKVYSDPSSNTPREPVASNEKTDFDYACSGGKLKNFENTEAGRRQAVITGNWFMAMAGNQHAQKWCRANGVEYRALNEGTNSAGGVFVPNQTQAAINNYLQRWGFARANCTIIPMAREILDLPMLQSGCAATYPGEGVAGSDSEPVFTYTRLTAEKITAYCPITEELEADNIYPVADIVVDALAQSVAEKEDAGILYGDGTSTYGGMTGIITKLQDGLHANCLVSTSGHDLPSEVDITDINNVVATLPSRFRANAKWICSGSIYAGVFQRLAAASNGNNIITYREGLGNTFMGFPFAITEKMPAGAASMTNKVMFMLGDLSKAVAFGLRSDTTIQRSVENKFLEGMVVYKITCRHAYAPNYIGYNGGSGGGPQYVGAMVGFQGYA